MTSLANELLSVLGKGTADPEVSTAIVDNAFVDVYDDPPFRRYVGSKKRGVCLLFDDDHVIDVQIYVQPTKLYSAFAEQLPFGIQQGMTQQQVHQLLGRPEIFDEFDSKYLVHDQEHRLSVVYDKLGIVRYLSVALLT